MNVYTVVNTLLELNVLNIQDIERHLRILASRAVHPQVERWVMTVARNYIINLSGEAVEAEYELYSGKKPRKGQSSDVPSVEKAPEWVRKNLEQSRDIHFFDPVQVRRRSFWKNLENIVDWFNGAWCDDDPKMQRLDRISFQEASKQAEVWKKGIDENPWAHTNDSKRVETVKEFPKGWRIVRITSPIGMSREGSLMSHCTSAETEIITSHGIFPIGKLVDKKVKVLTRNVEGGAAAWTEAEIKSFGLQKLWEVNLTRGLRTKTLFATAEHRWFAFNNTRNKQLLRLFEKTTSELEPGNRLASCHAKRIPFASEGPKGVSLSPVGVMHGIVFGDGHATVEKSGTVRSAQTILYGKKDAELLRWFPSASRTKSTNRSVGGTQIFDLPRYFKLLPPIAESVSYLAGWLAGYFAADGCVDDCGQAKINSANLPNLLFVEMLCQRFGIRNLGITTAMRKGYGIEASALHALTIEVGALPDDFFLLSSHRSRNRKRTLPPLNWTVKSIKPTVRYEEVFCAEVPVTHCFTLAGNILTGNCVGGSGYQTKMAAGTASYYSLRDKDNQPHVTIEVDTSGGLHKSSQLRGRANSDPKPEYKKMISAFFAEMKAAAGNVPGDWDDPFTRY